MCSGKVSSSCSTSGTRRVILVTNPMISHERGKERTMLKTNAYSKIKYSDRRTISPIKLNLNNRWTMFFPDSGYDIQQKEDHSWHNYEWRRAIGIQYNRYNKREESKELQHNTGIAKGRLDNLKRYWSCCRVSLVFTSTDMIISSFNTVNIFKILRKSRMDCWP